MIRILVTVALLSCAACGSGYLDNSATTQSIDSPEGNATAAAPWQADMSQAFVFGVQGALNVAYTAIQAGQQTKALNVSAPCATSFDSGGSIGLQGAWQPGTSGGNITGTLVFSDCPMQASDGNAYTLVASNVTIACSVTVTNPNDVVNDIYTCTSVSGTVSAQGPAGIATCPVVFDDHFVYAWGDNLTVSGAFEGTVCQQASSGSTAKSMPVTVP